MIDSGLGMVHAIGGAGGTGGNDGTVGNAGMLITMNI
jgi:hypothetical protein